MTDGDYRTIQEKHSDFGETAPKPKLKAPKPVRVVADISIVLIVLSLVVIVGTISMASAFSAPAFIEISLIALAIILVFFYRCAKKWAFIVIAAIYAINVGLWLYSIANGAPPDVADFALSSVIPIALLGVGIANWSSFK